MPPTCPSPRCWHFGLCYGEDVGLVAVQPTTGPGEGEAPSAFVEGVGKECVVLAPCPPWRCFSEPPFARAIHPCHGDSILPLQGGCEVQRRTHLAQIWPTPGISQVLSPYGPFQMTAEGKRQFQGSASRDCLVASVSFPRGLLLSPLIRRVCLGSAFSLWARFAVAGVAGGWAEAFEPFLPCGTIQQMFTVPALKSLFLEASPGPLLVRPASLSVGIYRQPWGTWRVLGPG